MIATAVKQPLYVTDPLLPPLVEFLPYLEDIWERKWLTNNGHYHNLFETALSEYLGVPYISLFANGTLALMTALQSLQISGEVITTPYSFVATTHSLLWNEITPVFVDIDPVSLNLDPAKIEAAITERTTAIMPVHCYGHPCDTVAIQEIAERHGLKVIYDAAHAFGVRNRAGSILNQGDLSVLSFHATKVFNTFEGGAIVSPDAATKLRIDQLKNFGFVDEVTVVAAGINGKMSEFNAALGLLQLQRIDLAIAHRGRVDATYRYLLQGLDGIECGLSLEGYTPNYSYFPILVGPQFALTRDELYAKFREHQIMARRYFYPLISEFPMYRHLSSANAAGMPVAHEVSSKVLCLPIFPGMTTEQVETVVNIIRTA